LAGKSKTVSQRCEPHTDVFDPLQNIAITH